MKFRAWVKEEEVESMGEKPFGGGKQIYEYKKAEPRLKATSI